MEPKPQFLKGNAALWEPRREVYPFRIRPEQEREARGIHLDNIRRKLRNGFTGTVNAEKYGRLLREERLLSRKIGSPSQAGGYIGRFGN